MAVTWWSWKGAKKHYQHDYLVIRGEKVGGEGGGGGRRRKKRIEERKGERREAESESSCAYLQLVLSTAGEAEILLQICILSL